MNKALIIGCGYTGKRLAERLSTQGVEVHATTRSGESPPGTHGHALDLLTPHANLRLPYADGCVVYYMVGPLHREYDATQAPHIAVMSRALTALKQEDIVGLVYLSSTSVYGDQQGGWVDEQTPLSPKSPWGQMRAELERAIWDFGAAQSIPAAVVRLPEIYGPGRGPIDRLRRGYALRFPERFSNRIHVDDLADVLAELGSRRDKELLLVSDGHPATTEEIYAYAADLAGLPAPAQSNDLPTDPNILSLVRDSKRCNNAALLAWLGRPLRFPSYREGVTQRTT